MRVSNNNQTTFGMNPNLDLSKASAKLKSIVEKNSMDILNIGGDERFCEILDPVEGKALVVVSAKAIDGKTYGGKADGPAKKIVEIVGIATDNLNRLLADTFLGIPIHRDVFPKGF